MVHVIERGLRGELPETLKEGDPIFNNTYTKIIASNIVSLRQAAKIAATKGYKTIILTSRLRGEARETAKALASIIESIYFENEPIKPPAAILAGGETTVTVRGDGIGGRNQELCLALLMNIDPRTEYVAVCMGTDGIDGISPAAGAIIDNTLLKEAYKNGLQPAKYLENNDSYSFFKKLGRAIEIGYTGTNVNDVFLAIIPKPASYQDRKNRNLGLGRREGTVINPSMQASS